MTARVPFTLAHPAAILPLRGRRYLRTAPLIVGAMAPDLPYYVPGSVQRFVPETHEFSASFTIDLALAYLALAGIYLLRRPLTALLTPRARWLCLHALAPLRADRRAWVYAGFAMILGVWTHLLWDSFTHRDGWIVRRVSALSAPVTIGSYTGPMCHVLQYVSSALGLLIMAVWYLRRPAPARAALGHGAARSPAAPILVLAAAAALLIGGVQSIGHYERTQFVYGSINVLLTRSLAWFALLYLVAGVVVTLDHPRVTRFRG
ncbi:MAG TPA: DUF4184 family protein [Steroidobacteraceae bacterium]|nr:DUF4184 family protein [Steroidobacteraceae bacterium]